MSKNRVDILLVECGLVESRSQAQRYIMAGQVRVDGQVILKPSTKINTSANLSIDKGPLYVSRGGEKLAAALIAFEIPVQDKVCADVGSSTGGFTDCLLQNGAKRVYAIDVGKGILDWKLRNHPQVRVMEGINARYLLNLPELVDLVTIDVSFISIKKILPTVKNWLKTSQIDLPSSDIKARSSVITLIKPQFEAGKEEVKRGKGVIKDPVIHQKVLMDVLNNIKFLGYGLNGLIRSPIKGSKGNTEFLAHFIFPGNKSTMIDSYNNKVIEVTEE